MTLIYKPDLDILKLYQRTKNELSRSMISKVIALQTDRQTDSQTDRTENISADERKKSEKEIPTKDTTGRAEERTDCGASCTRGREDCVCLVVYSGTWFGDHAWLAAVLCADRVSLSRRLRNIAERRDDRDGAPRYSQTRALVC